MGTYINNTFYGKKRRLPSTLKIGASYDYETKLQLSGFKIFKIMASAEYNDMLNSGLYTYDKLGAEFTFLETLKLRLGYYKEKINENSGLAHLTSISGIHVSIFFIILGLFFKNDGIYPAAMRHNGFCCRYFLYAVGGV